MRIYQSSYKQLYSCSIHRDWNLHRCTLVFQNRFASEILSKNKYFKDTKNIESIWKYNFKLSFMAILKLIQPEKDIKAHIALKNNKVASKMIIPFTNVTKINCSQVGNFRLSTAFIFLYFDQPVSQSLYHQLSSFISDTYKAAIKTQFPGLQPLILIHQDWDGPGN